MMMALAQGTKDNDSSRSISSRVRWLNNLLPSTGIEPINQFTNLNVSTTVVDDVELEAALEVGEDLALDDRRLSIAFNQPRHSEDIKGSDVETQSWRMRERMKTVSVALVICLNVGVDPPDVTKTQPCARVECWVDPMTLNPQRALEAIGNNLQRQYERWQPRARYRQSLDPTVEEVRRLATGLRRNARDERVLFHYNGHGVPKPTANGEIWVFNRSYTQYIPLSLYDLQSWMGSPSIFVYDCSNAGIIVSCFENFAEQHEREYLEQINTQGVSTNDLPAPISPRNCIQLAACGANQLLPMNPDLPADLFTACLTTPIKMALRWFVMQNQGKLTPRITLEMLDKIPGQFGDRRTMLGELNWIFTAITDTIAWNTLPRPLFQKLFRQDLLVASLFRNFLLAERVMRSYDCNPVSQPALPATHQHTMWHAWDLAVDMALSQLPNILDTDAQYKASTFFEEQLTAFEVWLKYGNERRPPPEQLPIVLQVLLSQAHRLRALDLLGRFLDLGPWAVNLALSVGIFPYVLKLLQSAARELRPLLVSIWAKILAVDTSCQNDLVRDASHKYFINVLQDECMMPQHRTWAAFILACIVHNFRLGQQEAEQSNLIAICLEHLNDSEPVLRQWLAIAVGRVWDHYEPARWRGARDNAHEKLYELLKDPVPEVRAAAVFALGTFINSCDERTEHANNLDHAIALHLLKASEDGSALVRQELVVALQHVVLAFESNFVTVSRTAVEEEELNSRFGGGGSAAGGHLQSTRSTTTMSPQASGKRSNKDLKGYATLQPSASSSALDRLASPGLGSSCARNSGSLLSMSLSALTFGGNVYTKIYSGLVFLGHDPHNEVASMANKLLDYLKHRAINKEAAAAARSSIHLESVSVPSSPARPSFLLPGNTSARVQPVGNVSTIAEESSESMLSTSADARTRPQRSIRAGSVGRHPSGGQHAPSSNSVSTTPPTLAPTTLATPKPVQNGARSTSRQTAPPQLTTNFIPWSSKYFTKQLMKHECDDCDCDHESERHWRREWLFQRNNEVRLDAENQWDLLRSRRGRLDGPVASLGVPTVLRNVPAFSPSTILFHPFSHEVVVAGQTQVTVWNAQQSRRISVIDVYDKKSPVGLPQVTSLEFINPHDESLLLVGCDDGSVRIYKDFAADGSVVDEERCSEDGEIDFENFLGEVAQKTRLVSAWNGLKDVSGFTGHRNTSVVSSLANLSITKASNGIKTAWSQPELILAVGGGSDSRYIRLWDASKELRKADVMSGTDAALTSLSFGPSHLGLLCAGFADGSVRLYDVRSPDSRVCTLDGQTSPILDCHVKGEEQQLSMLVSGDASGVVNYYELRNTSSSTKSKQMANIAVAPAGPIINGLKVHPRADVFAVWSQQSVSLHHFNPAGSQTGSSIVNVIKYHDEGVLGQRIGFEGCLAFHPYLLQIAIGSRDHGAVSLKGFKKTN